MTEWSYDMDAAPKGEYELVPSVRGGKDIERRVWRGVRILAADDVGEVVTTSSWLPDQERWNMFSKDRPPIAWAPYPEHPGLTSLSKALREMKE